MIAKRFVPLLLLTATFLLAGCATAGADGASSRDSTLITAEEITQSGAANLQDAVQRLRPRWLTARAARGMDGREGEIVVFQDNRYLGNTDVLRSLNSDAAYAIRYMDGPTAQGTLPGLTGRHIEGAIIVYSSARAMER